MDVVSVCAQLDPHFVLLKSIDHRLIWIDEKTHREKIQDLENKNADAAWP